MEQHQGYTFISAKLELTRYYESLLTDGKEVRCDGSSPALANILD
jgi:hypothetical protein